MIDRFVSDLLQWAAGHRDEGRYSPAAIVFHWTMAVLIAVQLLVGWRMGHLPAGADKLAAYNLHFAIGILMLTLVIGRAGWRLLAPDLINDADKPGWESTAAHLTHYLFYLCLFGLPLTGWAMVSATAREQDLALLGILPWPLLPLGQLPPERLWAIEILAELSHTGLVVLTLVLIPLHVGGALKHHFIDRNDVLHAMLPIVQPKPRRRTRWQRRYRAIEKRIAALAKRLTTWPRPAKGPAQRRT